MHAYRVPLNKNICGEAREGAPPQVVGVSGFEPLKSLTADLQLLAQMYGPSNEKIRVVELSHEVA